MIPYIDLHCDTLMQAWKLGQADLFHLPQAMVDLRRLHTAGCKAQFFAIFMPSVDEPEWAAPDPARDDAYVQACFDIFERSAAAHSDIFAPAGSLRQIEQNAAAGKVSGILTLEDGRAVAGRMENLERYYQKGVRLISLTWNQANCFGAPNSADPALMRQGLTPFGKAAVERMNQLGMLVDVSHLSDGGFWQVAELCTGPFIASHSNCRALNPHPRSLTDEMLRTLAQHGGVAGVNFAPIFLNRNTQETVSRVDDILRQLRHMIRVGGLECAALGTDLDGITGELEISSADQLPQLFEAMERNGFTPNEIEHIACKNAQRVLGEVMA